MFDKLINIANTLDSRGLKKEADFLDSVITRIAAELETASPDKDWTPLTEEQERQELIFKKPEELDDDQKKKLEMLLNKADEHEEFSGSNLVIGPEYDSRRIVFLLGDQVVGFMTPREENRFNGNRWRTGAIFVDEEFRGKSIAPSAIKQFFKDKKGYAWISNNNISSQRAFQAAGFEKGNERNVGDSPFDQGYNWFKD